MRHRGRVVVARRRVSSRWSSVAAHGALLASLAVGCGDASPAGPPGSIVTLETGDPPALIAFRDEGADWRSLAVAATTTFELEVTGPYEVVVVCESADRRLVAARKYARTLDDERTIDHLCGTAPFPFTVRGQMAESGQVWFGGAGRGRFAVDSVWDFTLPGIAISPLRGSFHDVQLSHSFLEATAATSITLDLSDVPGFKPEWQPDPTFDETRALTATRRISPGETTSASVTELAAAPTPVRGSRSAAPAFATRDDSLRLTKHRARRAFAARRSLDVATRTRRPAGRWRGGGRRRRLRFAGAGGVRGRRSHRGGEAGWTWVLLFELRYFMRRASAK
jgi:hypothetical protein